MPHLESCGPVCRVAVGTRHTTQAHSTQRSAGDGVYLGARSPKVTGADQNHGWCQEVQNTHALINTTQHKE